MFLAPHLAFLHTSTEPAQQEAARPEDSAQIEPSPAQLLAPPVFLQSLEDTQAVDGQELHMTCLVSGTPMPTISFFHDSRNIDDDEEFVISYNPDTGEVSSLYKLEQLLF